MSDLSDAGSGISSAVQAEAAELGVRNASTSWDLLAFLIAVIVLEHILLMLVMAFKELIPDIPESVVNQSIAAEKILATIADPVELRKKQRPENQNEIVTNTRYSNAPISSYRQKTPIQIYQQVVEESRNVKVRTEQEFMELASNENVLSHGNLPVVVQPSGGDTAAKGDDVFENSQDPLVKKDLE